MAELSDKPMSSPSAQINNDTQRVQVSDLLGTFQNQNDTDTTRSFETERNFEMEAETHCDALLENYTVPKFQPGDHVIRWKMIKVMLWPIQIHGIVLSSEVSEDGTCTVVMADFGYSSTEEDKKKKGFRNVNEMMRNFYDGKNDGKNDGNGIPSPANIQKCDEDEDDDEDLNKDGEKRFRLRTITDQKILKKWSKVNYGQSIFSSKGKFDKIKKLFKIPPKKSKSDDEDDEFFNSIKNERPSLPSNGSNDSAYTSLGASSDEFDNRGPTQMDPLQQLVAEANAVERRTGPRARRNRPRNGSVDRRNHNPLKSFNLKPPSMKGVNNFMKKLSFQKNKGDDYDTIATSTSNESKGGEEPKLPKSDPRAIVVARVKFILAEQDKPENETSLPKYHILYSNSECLAVWCKTGRFSTLQAAVFLHSTAVGNAKSSIMLGAGIAATQPWLIPVVGVYAVAAVGMPYYILNKCKNKWKEGEMRLTHGFWETADNEVYVAAVQNWSGLCPEDEEDSDEVKDKDTDESKDQIVQV